MLLAYRDDGNATREPAMLWKPSEAELRQILHDHRLWLHTKDFSPRSASRRQGQPADLSRADLRGADLSGVDVREATLREADLSRANLFMAQLHRADCTATIFRGADLAGAGLGATNLTGADLREADLTSADLSGVRFLGADFRGARVEEVDIDAVPWTQLAEAHLPDSTAWRCAWRLGQEEAERLAQEHPSPPSPLRSVRGYYLGGC